MLVTLIVRLFPEPLAEGEVVGEVEDVGTGQRRVVRELGELVAFAREAVDGGVAR